MRLLCLLRAVLQSLRCGVPLSGHSYVLQLPEYGQPKCVDILKCSTCGKLSVAWSLCVRCGLINTGAKR